LAKEDHIYRLNHVLNTLFRFNLHQFDQDKLHSAVALANYLFDTAGLDHLNLPRPLLINTNASDMQQQQQQQQQPALYSTLCLLLHAPRPSKLKPMCHNCNTKPASRRKLCVACYRYQLKHGEARPLRLIVANRPGPTRVQASSASFSSVMESNHSPRSTSSQLPVVFYSPKMSAPSRAQKFCANCGVQETHQWYRNLCGSGHWCETCKSYYLRHTKVRPPELFVKAAKRKVDIRTLVNWSAWSWDEASPVSSPTISASSRQTTAESRRSSASSITSTSTASSLSTC
ncbi:uncharacterized protein BYT42DRAFT_469934, partial [Radiomyces spectabilis]|uniref:uncharacterized protein n=1 Tax=Radiomyces spectabilis TaxID=64574 RepID=UPI002220DFD1